MTMMDDPAGVPLAPPEPAVAADPGVKAEFIKRDPGEVDQSRSALVKQWIDRVKEAKKERSRVYARMRRDMAFVRPGRQWGRAAGGGEFDDDRLIFDAPYEANLVQRHIQQRVAALYAKNPVVIAKRRRRMDFAIWDGDQKTLQKAIARQGVPPDPATGNPGSPPMPMPGDQELFMDIEEGMTRRKMIDRVARTLEILYGYYQSEGTPNFKMMAKQLVRRVLTCGVGFVQLGFQRVMGRNVEIENRIRDDEARINYLEALAGDLADEKIEENSAEIERLKNGLTALQMQRQVVLREGLVFDFPAATDIIVDLDCKQLKGFVGAKWIAREYHYTPEQMKANFGIDLGKNFTPYEATNTWRPSKRDSKASVAVVWAVWDADVGVVNYVCDGYPDFLKEPLPPEIFVEGFFPFLALSFNDLEDPNDIYPPSDVTLLRPMQLEYNRSREGLREHRIANKPGYVTAKGMLDDEGKTNLENHAPNEVVELNVSPEAVKDMDKLLRPRPTVPISPEVYDTEYLFGDIQRVAGDQTANYGGTSGSTATEASIAETSRVAGLQSNIDDVNDFLSAMARMGGAILLAEMSAEQVTKIVGPGATWPELSREEISEEIYLEIQAGSSGRPNKAVEIANWERMMPFLIQMKGVSQDWLLRQTVQRLDENIDIEDAFEIDVPSVVAQNAIDSALGKAAAAPMQPASDGEEGGGQVQPGGQGPDSDPNLQGDRGALNDVGVPRSLPGPKPDIPHLTP